MPIKKPDHAAWLPAKWELADASAIKGLFQGTADEGQQKRALSFIIEKLCGTYDLSFSPTSERDTCFAEGKRFVGSQIVKLIKVNLSTIKEPTENG